MTRPTGLPVRPTVVIAAALLVAANAVVALAYGAVNNVPTAYVGLVALGLIAWGVWRGSDIARGFVWLFAGLTVVSLALQIAEGINPVSWITAPPILSDLTALAAGILVGLPAARDFFLARRRMRESARVEYLDD